MAKRPTRSRNKATRKRMLRENRDLEYEAKHERYVVIDGETSQLPAPGWGTTEGDLPGWRAPRVVAPATTYHNGIDPDVKPRRGYANAPMPSGRDRKIQRSFVPDSRFCTDSFCGAQLADGRCPNGHAQRKPKP